MVKPSITVISLVLCLTLLSCQSYTTGLQQGSNKADETAVIASLQTVGVAQRSYSVTNGGDYGTFQQLVAAGALDSRFNSDKPQIKGYNLTMTVGEKTFSCNADPIAGGASARHFYIDSTSNEVHANLSQPAKASDPAL
jgi:hypothetical protein